jgi:hypothetical protein
MTDVQTAPEIFQIPDANIAQWTAIPVDAELRLHLTRDDLDNLFFAVRNLAYAIANLQAGLGNTTPGTPESAMFLQNASNMTIESANRISRFMAKMMETAEPAA